MPVDGYTIIKGAPQPIPLDQAVQRVHELSTLPQVALHTVRLANDPSVGAAQLTRVVESDPALCARLLRCVNSAAYGLRFKITTVQRAVSYLGFSAVRNLALTAAISEVFKRDAHIAGYSRVGLWRHMVGVAVAARMTARRAGLADFEEAFLAGLLHDLGIILEDQYCHPHFTRVVQSLDGYRPLVEAERQVLGFDHTVYADRVAEVWKFPEAAMVAIRCHHDPEAYDGLHRRLLACVVVADLITTLKGRPEVERVPLTPCPQALATLGLDVEGLKVLADDLDQEWAEHEQLIALVDPHG